MVDSTAAEPRQHERLARIAALAPDIRRRARKLDDLAAFPAETFAQLHEGGLLALTAPREFGGAGLWWDGGYRDFYERLEPWTSRDGLTLWRRMMVLGPPPEFCLVAPSKIQLPAAMSPETLQRETI